MAYFSGQGIVFAAPQPYPDYPGWETIDCGCCAGIEWGDPGPRECRQCGGGGYLARHIASGAVALYPGGPFRWREKPKVNR
jgi:hypothetical protein